MPGPIQALNCPSQIDTAGPERSLSHIMTPAPSITLSRRRILTFCLMLLACPLPAADERPVVDDRSVVKERPAGSKLPTLWIAGDSTVRSNAPQRGWGQDLGTFFDSGKINVVNRAIGGRSARTFFTEGKWRDLESALKPGDFVIIQFGHNDVGHLDERSKFRGSVKGIGDETENVAKPDGSTEVVHSYGWYLRAMARGARAKGAKVILCSPVPHKKFDRNGNFVPDWTEWRGWVESCAKSEHAAFLDLAGLIGLAYSKLDRSIVESFFADERTHTSAAGAMFNARIAVSGLRAIPTAPIDRFLSEAGREIPPAGH